MGVCRGGARAVGGAAGARGGWRGERVVSKVAGESRGGVGGRGVTASAAASARQRQPPAARAPPPPPPPRPHRRQCGGHRRRRRAASCLEQPSPGGARHAAGPRRASRASPPPPPTRANEKEIKKKVETTRSRRTRPRGRARRAFLLRLPPYTSQLGTARGGGGRRAAGSAAGRADRQGCGTRERVPQLGRLPCAVAATLERAPPTSHTRWAHGLHSWLGNRVKEGKRGGRGGPRRPRRRCRGAWRWRLPARRPQRTGRPLPRPQRWRTTAPCQGGRALRGVGGGGRAAAAAAVAASPPLTPRMSRPPRPRSSPPPPPLAELGE